MSYLDGQSYQHRVCVKWLDLQRGNDSQLDLEYFLDQKSKAIKIWILGLDMSSRIRQGLPLLSIPQNMICKVV